MPQTFRKPTHCRVLVLLLVGVVGTTGAAMAQPQTAEVAGTTPLSPADEPKFPSLDEVKATTTAHLAEPSDYQPGDLLSRGDVTRLFPKLAVLGWKVADQREITELLLTDADFLVTQLRTRSGRKFMRRIALLPDGYDRLDRLRGMPGGERQIRELIKSPGGDKLIEYMTTTPQGANLGRSLSRGTGGKGFNKPTPRLYTEQDLIGRLETSYRAEVARREALEKSVRP